MSPRSVATLYRGTVDKHADDTGTAMTAIAQSLLTGPSVTLSSAHLTPKEVAKWITHQRAQSNSHQRAFMGDDRDQDCRLEDMNTFFQALEERPSGEPSGKWSHLVRTI